MARPVGVLLLQLGTPDEPTPAAYRRYLLEFLSDPRVIEAPGLLWWFVLRFLILPRRTPRMVESYRRVWSEAGGSPLLVATAAQAKGLEERLEGRATVRFAMRYGSPSLGEALDAFAAAETERLIFVPLYPQYSSTTTGSALDALAEGIRRRRFVPAIRTASPFYDHPAYIDALASGVRRTIAPANAPPDMYVFSFHGLPRSYAERGDPYPVHCRETARLLAVALGLAPEGWVLSYQSRFGREPWLEPGTQETVESLAARGVRRILVVTPGFVADCLETIDEIGRDVAGAFRKAGGRAFVRCPCLGDDPVWLDALARIVREEGAGWL
ncbi:MAG: ferrochelatase [Planctomycetes bacterium]|nr:ferrochelatase [Planctomycetota bacterium]